MLSYYIEWIKKTNNLYTSLEMQFTSRLKLFLPKIQLMNIKKTNFNQIYSSSRYVNINLK